MANREKGQLGVTVGETRYTLEPTFDAACELEDLIGKKLDAPDGPMVAAEQGRLSGLRAVTWCILQEHHGDEIRTLKDASRWIERAGGADVVSGWVIQLFELNDTADTSEKTGGAANPPDAQPSTGTNSSPAPVESA